MGSYQLGGLFLIEIKDRVDDGFGFHEYRNIGLARRVKIIEKLKNKTFGTKCYLKTITKIINNKLFLLQIKRPLENFHEIFGLGIYKDIL
jgi:hypothetical protein